MSSTLPQDNVTLLLRIIEQLLQQQAPISLEDLQLNPSPNPPPPKPPAPPSPPGPEQQIDIGGYTMHQGNLNQNGVMVWEDVGFVFVINQDEFGVTLPKGTTTEYYALRSKYKFPNISKNPNEAAATYQRLFCADNAQLGNIHDIKRYLDILELGGFPIRILSTCVTQTP